jgi:hypothetical protein
MRLPALLTLAALAAPAPALAASPLDAAVKRARAVKPTPKFPFGLQPVTQQESLAGQLGTCLAPDAAGGQTCWLKPGTGTPIDAGAFRPQHVSVRFTPAAGDGRRDLYAVTASMEGIATCQAMSDALQSAIKMAITSYGKPKRVQEGPRAGSTQCRDYRSEGQVFYRAQYPGWQLTADVYWADGFTVYLTWMHEGGAEAHARALEQAQR